VRLPTNSMNWTALFTRRLARRGSASAFFAALAALRASFSLLILVTVAMVLFSLLFVSGKNFVR
jgi:hypothetical protein